MDFTPTCGPLCVVVRGKATRTLEQAQPEKINNHVIMLRTSFNFVPMGTFVILNNSFFCITGIRGCRQGLKPPSVNMIIRFQLYAALLTVRWMEDTNNRLPLPRSTMYSWHSLLKRTSTAYVDFLMLLLPVLIQHKLTEIYFNLCSTYPKEGARRQELQSSNCFRAGSKSTPVVEPIPVTCPTSSSTRLGRPEW